MRGPGSSGDDLTPFLKSRRHGLGPDRAYPDLRAAEAARRLVGSGAVWTIADDNRRLVESGTHPDALREIAETLGRAWVTHGQDVRGRAMALAAQGGDNAIDFDRPFHELTFPAELKIATRLGLDDLLLSLSAPIPSPFGATLDRLKIPGWMLGDALQALRTTEAEPVIEAGGDGGLTLAGKSFTYDRFGLRPAGAA